MRGSILRRYAAFILGGFLAFNLLWHLAAQLLELRALPAPLEVYAAWERALQGGLAAHLAASMSRAVSSLALALMLGLLLGIPMGCSRKVNRLLGPLLYFSYPVPKLALLPVLLLLLGIGEASKIAMIVLIIVFQIALSVRDAARAVPEEDYALLASLGAGFFAKLRHIVLPASLPAIFSSLRVSIGIVFSALFFTESFGADYGLGLYITDSQMRLDYPLMYFGIVILSLGALLLFLLVDAADRLFCRWR